MKFSCGTIVIAATSNFFTNAGLVQGIKIAFVGDTGMEDVKSNGYGHLTMKMINDERVDLVVDVGDYDYWGRCTEEYEVKNILDFDTILGGSLQVPEKSTLKRFKWQDGRHGSIKGWEIGVQSSGDDPTISSSKELSIVTDLFERHIISDSSWEGIKNNLKLRSGERDCYGDPWDGPWSWNQFLREYDFDFLGASGNAEVKEGPTYGSAEIWATHQRYMHKLYMERIYNTNRGACHGYENQNEPGAVDEYGERYSCFYNNADGDESFQFIFLGWWQGSNEGGGNDAKQERQKSIEFIEREFDDERSQNVPWRFCIHHMTSAKLSAGDKSRNSMILAGITDACRKRGALIISGHHHVYSRTKMLQSVGGPRGDEDVLVADADTDTGQSSYVLEEGLTMSITTGMGGYDGACNGLYHNATWMERCISRPSNHRGAIIAEFDEKNPLKGTFQYMNSMADGEVVDQFHITSALSSEPKPTRRPSRKPTTPRPTTKPSSSPTESTGIGKVPAKPSSSPTTESTGTEKEPSRRPTRKPTRNPIPKPSSNPESTQTNKPSRKSEENVEEGNEKEEEEEEENVEENESGKEEENEDEKEEVCISIHQIICSDDRFSTFCELINEYDLVDYLLSIAFTLTVFAPTNSAFKAMKDNELLDFDDLTREQSIYVLLYHFVVVVGEETVYTYSDLECSGLLKTANGESSRTKCDKDDNKYQRGPMQKDDMIPKIDVADVEACNGIVHVVDQVILPNLEKMPTSFLS